MSVAETEPVAEPVAAAVAPRDLSYNTHKYLSIILAKSSLYFKHPSSLADKVPGITHLGQLGVLDDVHIYSVPLDHWGAFETANKVDQLRDIAGVVNVSVQAPTQRQKRDEV
jgi:hypothetical protein